MGRLNRCIALFAMPFLFFSCAMAACSHQREHTPPSVTSISVSGEKRIFSEGEAFSVGEMTVTASLSNGKNKTLRPEEYEIDSSAFMSAAVGKYTIRITLCADISVKTEYETAVFPINTSWEEYARKLQAYGGEWLSIGQCYGNSITSGMPDSPLLGNGDAGAVSDGNDTSKSWHISKNDFWSSGNLNNGTINKENENATTVLPVGGVTLGKYEAEDGAIPLTRMEGVTATASSEDNSMQNAAKAIDSNAGVKSDTGKNLWISKPAKSGDDILPHTLNIDLGEVKTVAKFALISAGHVWNETMITKAFKIEVSENGVNYLTAAEITNNKNNVYVHVFSEPFRARYIKLAVTEPHNPTPDGGGWIRARIAEFELYSSADGESALLKEMTAGRTFGDTESDSLTKTEGVKVTADSESGSDTAAKAIDGSIGEADNVEHNAWITVNDNKNHYIQLDFGKKVTIDKWAVYGVAHIWKDTFISSELSIYTSENGKDWTCRVAVSGNKDNVVAGRFSEPVKTRWVKLVASPGEGSRVRIAEFELFAPDGGEGRFLPENAFSFREKQDISVAEVETQMKLGAPLDMQTFLSARENIMITRITAAATVELKWSVWAKTSSAAYPVAAGYDRSSEAVWAKRSTVNNAAGDDRSWTSEAVLASKLVGAEYSYGTDSARGSAFMRFTAEKGCPMYIVTSISGGGRTYDGNGALTDEAPLEEARVLLGKINSADDAETTRERHRSWWKDYWMLSSVGIEDEDISKAYYGSMYLAGASMRDGSIAPGLYGPWVTTDSPLWLGDYHLNYNYMAPRYGMQSANRLEGLKSVMQPILDYMPQAEINAKEDLAMIDAAYVASRKDLQNGIDDAVLYPVGIAPWGVTSWVSSKQYCTQTLNSLFAATLFMQYYDYTMDGAWLKETGYPFLDKVANFYLAWCEKDATDEGYVYHLYDGAHEEYFGKDAGVSLGLTKSLMGFLLETVSVTGASAEKVSAWKDLYDHLAPVPTVEYTFKNGETKTIYALNADWKNRDAGYEDVPGIRPLSACVELEFVMPGMLLGFGSDPRELEIARNTVAAKIDANPSIWAQNNNSVKMFVQAALVGYDPSEILSVFKTYQLTSMKDNFVIQDGYHGLEKVGWTEMLHAMLLQNFRGVTKLFANWTGEDASFEKLRVKGAFLVSAEMKNGTATFAEIESEAGGRFSLILPQGWRDMEVFDEDGDKVSVEISETEHTGEKIFSWHTEAGKSYIAAKK